MLSNRSTQKRVEQGGRLASGVIKRVSCMFRYCGSKSETRMHLHSLKHTHILGSILLLLPLAPHPTVGFGLSNNALPFFPICHQLSPIFSLPALEELFRLPLSIFSWVFPFHSSLPVLEWRSFWASYPPPIALGDLTNLSFELGSINIT